MNYTLEFIFIVAGALFIMDAITLGVVLMLRVCKFSEFTYYFLGTIAVGILSIGIWVLFSDLLFVAAALFVAMGTVVVGWKNPKIKLPVPPVSRTDVMV